VQRACRLVRLSRSAWYSRPVDRLKRDAEVIDALQELAEQKPRWGFWKYRDRLKNLGRPWNHKRIYRVYCELGLNHRRKTKKRLCDRPPQPLEVPAQPNKVWSLDFVHDTLYVGRRFRTLNVMDEGVREALAIEVDTSLPAARVVRVLDQIKSWAGRPRRSAATTGRSFSVMRSAAGARRTMSRSSTSSRAGQTRTRSSSGSTGRSVAKCSALTCSRISIKSARSPGGG